MKLAILDTNVLIDFLQNGSSLVSLLRPFDGLLVPSVVVGEFVAGIFPTPQGAKNRMILNTFLESPSVSIAPITQTTAECCAKIFQVLKKQGTPIPQNDMWIAASALENNAAIVTADRHFSAIPLIDVISV